MKNVNQTIVETFREVAEYLETGRSGRRPRLLLTGMGSEHGEENSMQAAVMAARVGLDVSYIGTLEGEGRHHAFPFPHRRVHCGTGGNARPW